MRAAPPLYALDTDTVSLFLRQDPVVTPRLLGIPPSLRALPIVTVQELVAG